MTEHNVGWVEYENGFWRYYDEPGTAIQGWKNINNKWYYFNEKEGREWMHRGWLTYNDNRYYFDQNGAMISGWENIDNTWYYFDQDGAMQKSRWIDNHYLNETGEMVENGWFNVDGENYYFDNEGHVDKNKKYQNDIEQNKNNSRKSDSYYREHPSENPLNDGVNNHLYLTKYGKNAGEQLELLYNALDDWNNGKDTYGYAVEWYWENTKNWISTLLDVAESCKFSFGSNSIEYLSYKSDIAFIHNHLLTISKICGFRYP